MNTAISVLLGLGLLAPLSVALWAHLPRWPLPADARADQVLLLKHERRLLLLQDGTVLREYRVALGPQPRGHKQREGDGRTPEGFYRLDWRNPRSRFHLSLHVSYPDANDEASARTAGHPAGGAIMIHGLRNGSGWLGRLHRLSDWTQGCIAVTNTEIAEIWRVVADGTPIELRP